MERAELLDAIIELRHLQTLMSNFLSAPVDADRRVRTSFSLVETGRLSSHEDELGSGTHLQNMPTQLRGMFVADEGMTLVEADKKQGEAMIVAWLAEDESMKDVFRKGGDVHRINASYIFGKREEDVTAEERYLAKRMVHASNYLMGINTMAAYCNMLREEARAAQEAYFASFPKIRVWQNRVKEEVFKRRVLINPFGRRRIFFERLGDELWREALAFLPQSTLVDDVNRGLVEFFYKAEPEIQILHQGHDSVLVQCKHSDLSMTINLLKECFERPFLCGGDVLTIPVEIKRGDNWKEMIVC
jgi:DNA polymerase-1